eukprot:s3230_g1.t1
MRGSSPLRFQKKYSNTPPDDETTRARPVQWIVHNVPNEVQVKVEEQELGEQRRFEHLEHIDDDLSWGGLQAAASAAVKPCRILKTLVILSPFLLSAMTPRHLTAGELRRSSYELTRTLLTHACAASLSYLVLGFAFQVITIAALRISRLCCWRTAEKIIYLRPGRMQGDLQLEYLGKDTRVLLARPCACILLLLFCNALKKILEFSFLRSKLALNFETDVLVNAFERAAIERVADFACLPDMLNYSVVDERGMAVEGTSREAMLVEENEGSGTEEVVAPREMPRRFKAAAITAMILVVCAVAFYMTSPCRNPLSLFRKSSNIQLAEAAQLEAASRHLKSVTSREEADKMVKEAMQKAKEERIEHHKNTKLPPLRTMVGSYSSGLGQFFAAEKLAGQARKSEAEDIVWTAKEKAKFWGGSK